MKPMAMSNFHYFREQSTIYIVIDVIKMKITFVFIFLCPDNIIFFKFDIILFSYENKSM